jgi:hypothetical protein
MNFEKIWQQYDFTESELLSMGWQFPYNYILNFNYYWDLNPTHSNIEALCQSIVIEQLAKQFLALIS